MKIKYSIKALKNNKFLTFILTLQLFCGFYSFYNIFDYQKRVNEENDKVNRVYAGKSIYRLIQNEEMFYDSFENYNKFIKTIEEIGDSRELAFTIAAPHSFGIEIFEGYEKFKVDGSLLFKINNKTFCQFNSVFVNKNALTTFQVEVEEGRLFNKEEYLNNNDNVIPIILGYNYSKYLKVGDIINHSVGLNTVKAKVIGILKKDQSIPLKFDTWNVKLNADVSPNFLKLDNQIIIAYGPGFEDGDFFSGHAMYYNFISIDKGLGRENQQQILDKIKAYIEEATGVRFNLKSYDKEVTAELDKYNSSRKTYLYTTLTILLFLSITIVVSMLNSINKRKKEFGVYFFSGATMKEIILIICFEMIIMSVIALIASVGALYIDFNFLDPAVEQKYDPALQLRRLDFSIIGLLFVGGIVYSIITSLVPINKLRKLSVSELLRRDD